MEQTQCPPTSHRPLSTLHQPGESVHGRNLAHSNTLHTDSAAETPVSTKARKVDSQSKRTSGIFRFGDFGIHTQDQPCTSNADNTADIASSASAADGSTPDRYSNRLSGYVIGQRAGAKGRFVEEWIAPEEGTTSISKIQRSSKHFSGFFSSGQPPAEVQTRISEDLKPSRRAKFRKSMSHLKDNLKQVIGRKRARNDTEDVDEQPPQHIQKAPRLEGEFVQEYRDCASGYINYMTGPEAQAQPAEPRREAPFYNADALAQLEGRPRSPTRAMLSLEFAWAGDEAFEFRRYVTAAESDGGPVDYEDMGSG